MAETRVSTSTCPGPGGDSGSSRTSTLPGATKKSDRLQPGIDEVRQDLPGPAQRVLPCPPRTVDAHVTSERIGHQVDDGASFAGDVAVDARPQVGFCETRVGAVHHAGRATPDRLDEGHAEGLLWRGRHEQPG